MVAGYSFTNCGYGALLSDVYSRKDTDNLHKALAKALVDSVVRILFSWLKRKQRYLPNLYSPIL
ncbi:hypothetical protein V2J09_022592 [Rumex salicifolius]